MTLLQEAKKLLVAMSRAEKAQLLQWVVQDLGDAFPGIESVPGVCGGDPCIVRTRIPVWVLEQYRQLDVCFINTLPVLVASRHSRESGNPGDDAIRTGCPPTRA